MNVVNALLSWIETRLAAGWFQYGYIGIATCMTWEVVHWAESYAATALAAKADMQGTALVIGAVSAVAGGVQAFAFKHHLENKDSAQ